MDIDINSWSVICAPNIFLLYGSLLLTVTCDEWKWENLMRFDLSIFFFILRSLIRVLRNSSQSKVIKMCSHTIFKNNIF